MPVKGYVAVHLCSVGELARLLNAAEWQVSEAARSMPELEALLARLRATVGAASEGTGDEVYLVGKAEW